MSLIRPIVANHLCVRVYRSFHEGKHKLDYFVISYFIFYDHHFCFPAKLVGGFTLSDFLYKPWSQVSSLLPGTCLHFISRTGFSIPTARRFSSNVRYSIFMQEKVLTSVHSMRIEPTNLILVGTRGYIWLVRHKISECHPFRFDGWKPDIHRSQSVIQGRDRIIRIWVVHYIY